MATNIQPEPACLVCSKPIRPGTEAKRDASIHLRCLAGQTQDRALEGQVTARERIERAQTLGDRARERIEEARTLRGNPCPICQKPLSDGRPILFKGVTLRHAACWESA
jgi:hypothetical protein